MEILDNYQIDWEVHIGDGVELQQPCVQVFWFEKFFLWVAGFAGFVCPLGPHRARHFKATMRPHRLKTYPEPNISGHI